MDNQVFYNPNSNNNASRFRNPQFRSFNPKPKSAPEVEKGLSLSAKPTHTAGESEECEEPPARTVASPTVDTRLHDSVHVQTPEFPAPKGHHAENDCSSNSSPVGNASDNDNDSEDDLRSLFSELEDDSSDTESNPDCKVEGIQKPSSDDIVGETGRLSTGDSKDTPIVLDDESFANTTDGGEEEEPRSFSERIPLSLAEANSGTAKRSASGKRKRDLESKVGLPDAKQGRLLSHDGTEEAQLPSPTETSRDADRHSNETQSDVVWEYRALRGYKIVDGKPFVLVDWCETWEPADGFQMGEVESVRQRYGLQRRRKRGRPFKMRAQDN